MILNPRGWYRVPAFSIPRTAKKHGMRSMSPSPKPAEAAAPSRIQRGRELHAHGTACLVSVLKGIHSKHIELAPTPKEAQKV